MTLKDIAQMTKLEERAEKAEAEREKLIGALEPFAEINIDLATKAVLGNVFTQLILNARAVLAEEKEQG